MSLYIFSNIPDLVFTYIRAFMDNVLLFPVFGVPFIVGFLAISAFMCTILTGFINIRMFKRAVLILFSKDGSSGESGQIAHLQAFITALSGTVGLGTIAGVAFAVSLGGPGAIGWMIIAGFFGMSLKFLEVSLAFKNRVVLSKKIPPIGGPFSYMKNGLTKIGFPKLGVFTSKLYSVLLLFSGLFGSIAFQSNQIISIVGSSSKFIHDHPYIPVSVITILLIFITTGGLKRVAKASSSLVPLMAIVYLSGCMVIIVKHIDNLMPSINLIISEMFNPNSIYGGAMGAMVAGLRRAVFANEAGMGTAAIAHSATDEKEPIKVGLVAMLEPCFDTMIVCVISGLTIIVSGAYKMGHIGIMMSRDAFLSVADWFVVFLQFSAPLFAFTTIVTFSYYCEIAWSSLFSTMNIIPVRVLVLLSVIASGFAADITQIALIGDTFFMLSATLNILALIFMHREVISDLNLYLQKSKNNLFSSDLCCSTEPDSMESETH